MEQNLWALLQMMEASLPVVAVTQSLHAQAMQDPVVREDPAMIRYTDLTRTNINALITGIGFIRRILWGDRGPTTMEALNNQLGVLGRTHLDANAAFTQAMTNPRLRQAEPLQSMAQVMGIAEQAYRAMLPVLQTILPAEVFTGAN
jgi:hypothetical protein